MLDKQGYMHAPACTRPRARPHAQAHARGHTHTRARAHITSRTYCFSTATIFRERASVLGHTYIACLVVVWFYKNLECSRSFQ